MVLFTSSKFSLFFIIIFLNALPIPRFCEILRGEVKTRPASNLWHWQPLMWCCNRPRTANAQELYSHISAWNNILLNCWRGLVKINTVSDIGLWISDFSIARLHLYILYWTFGSLFSENISTSTHSVQLREFRMSSYLVNDVGLWMLIRYLEANDRPGPKIQWLDLHTGIVKLRNLAERK